MKNALLILIACVLLCAVASADADSIVLALSGEPAPGGIVNPSNPIGLYFRFSVPVLNRLGQIAFQAELEDTHNGVFNDMAIFRVDSEEEVLIVQEGSKLPSWETSFNSFYLPAINYTGKVGFWAEDRNGRTGIYTGAGDGIPTQVVRENEPSPDGNGRFDEISKYVLRPLDMMGNVAFQASFKDTAGGVSDDTAIVLTLGSVPTLVAREGSPSQIGVIGSGDYLSFPSEHIALSRFGEVAFWASIDFPSWSYPVNGIISGRSPLRLLAYEGLNAPGGGYLSVINRQPNIYQGNSVNYPSVAFHAFLNNTPGGPGNDDIGLYKCDASNPLVIHEIARTGDSPPDENGQYDTFSWEVSLNHDMAAFRATMRNTSDDALFVDGIYRNQQAGSTNETIKIARGGDLATGAGGGVIYQLRQPVMNRFGQVAFRARLWVSGSADTEAIYIGNGGILLEMARTGEPLLGSTIIKLQFATGPDSLNGFNYHCQVAYKADLADGREVLLLATPMVEWTGGSNGNWPDNANWTLGIEPAAVHDVVIAPDHSVDVSGPRANATVKSLTIGNAAGNPAALNLVIGGDMTVVNTCTVMPGGTVEIGDGRSFAAGNIVSQGAVTFQSGVGNVFGEVANGPGGSIVVPAGAEAWMHGPLDNQGVVDVAAGAEIHLTGLTGNGSSGGGTVYLGGEVRTGRCIGLMNFGGNVVFERLSFTYIELGASCLPAHDLIVVEGDLTLAGSLVLESCGPPAWLTPGQRFEIIDVEGKATGRFFGLDEGDQVAIFDGVPLHITYIGGDDNDVELYALPEPATLALLALGGLALLRRRRR